MECRPGADRLLRARVKRGTAMFSTPDKGARLDAPMAACGGGVTSITRSQEVGPAALRLGAMPPETEANQNIRNPG